jgi:hypothetical protein
MEQVVRSLGHEIYTDNNNNHKGFLVKWSLIGPLCKKWSRNRDPDIFRVDEMLAHFEKGGYLPKMIHLAEVLGEGLVCYDGNHRREMFDRCKGDDITCIVDIMFGANQNDVYKAFSNINKSIQVPAIYIDNQDASQVKIEIINLVKKYEEKYKPFLSSSPRCHSPNFNRDGFVDNVYQIYTSFNGSKTIPEIAVIFDRLNVEYAYGRLCRPHRLYKLAVIEKCQKHGFWLFLERSIPFEHVELLAYSTGAL